MCQERSSTIESLAVPSIMLRFMVLAICLSPALSSCSTPLVPYDVTSVPVVSLPLTSAGIEDSRGRFREIFCAVLEARRESIPDYEPCASALVAVGNEPKGSGAPVALEAAESPLSFGFVPGVGWGCFIDWVEPNDLGVDYIRRFGYDGEIVKVDALSSSVRNAEQVRDWVLDYSQRNPDRKLVLIGYSKGASDILQALVDYPEIIEHVTAVVSMAGSIGGSPLANRAKQSQLELLTHWPKSDCDEGDGGAIESLTPRVRQAWLAANQLPAAVRYYSLVTAPHPDRISSVLKRSYRKLAKIDGRNDGMLISEDQIIPGSTLIGFTNSDHWAIAVPVARSHPFFGRTFVNRNGYPREALLESVLRFLEEDLTQDRLRALRPQP